VQAYVNAIDPARQPLFDRVRRLVLEVHPTAEVVLSYKMPTYVVGRHRLYVGVWRHGLSFYGWTAERTAGFVARHPDLVGSKGTLKLTPADAEDIDDDELRAFLAAALGD
jgi:hypothetical protein